MPRAEISRDRTGRVNATITVSGAGDRPQSRTEMSIDSANTGEDVPLTVHYYDDADNAVDPDDQGTDGVPDADVTIVDRETDTEVITAAAMTHVTTGEMEYVWDSDVDANGAGSYRVSIAAEFSGETKVSRDTIELT